MVDNGKDADGHPKLTARSVFITTGETRGDQVVVLDGVKEGDTVVSAGQNKLRNGAVILIDNSVKPKIEANPTPVDQ